MKIFKRILSAVFIIALACLVGFALKNGVGNFKDTDRIDGVSIETTRETPILTDFAPTDEYVRSIGRTVFENNVLWASMSGSGAEFDCVAQYLDITLLCENPNSLTSNHLPRVAVFANDDIVYDAVLSEEETVVHVDLTDYEDHATIKIIKLSESMFSAFGIGNISVFAKKDIEPTEEKSVKIEFIGDSITAGYGIDEENSDASFSTQTENFSKTYAYLTAQKLDAQYSAVAFSGYGVLSGSSSSGYMNSSSVIFNVYDKAITNKTFETSSEAASTASSYEAYYTSEYEAETQQATDEWNFEAFTPDFVVINLGTNDASYCTTDERRLAFKEKYIELIELVREKNPDAYIICLLGDMNNSLYLKIEEAVVEYKSENIDRKILATTLTFNMDVNGSVIDGHPSEKANAVAANELAQIINEVIARNSTADEDETTTAYSSDNSAAEIADETTADEAEATEAYEASYEDESTTAQSYYSYSYSYSTSESTEQQEETDESTESEETTSRIRTAEL